MAIFKSYETIVEKINTIHCKENIIYVYLRSYSMESSCVLLVGISTIKEYISQKREKDLKWMKRLLYYRCFTEGHGNPLQYSHLENPMDRGVWWAKVHRATHSQIQQTQLSTHSHTVSKLTVYLGWKKGGCLWRVHWPCSSQPGHWCSDDGTAPWCFLGLREGKGGLLGEKGPIEWMVIIRQKEGSPGRGDLF